MRFLIAIQNFNQGKYLRSCLSGAMGLKRSAESLGHSLSVVLLDAGSADDSLSIASHFPEVGIFSHGRLTQAQAINRLLESRKVTYDLFGIVNGDDYLLPTWAEAHLRTLEAHPSADFLHGYCLMWLEESFSVYKPDADTWEQGFRSRANRISHPTFCIPERTFEKYGLFDEGIVHAYDMEFTCRLWAKGAQLVLTKEPVALYRFHANNGHRFLANEAILEHNEILSRYMK